LGYYGAIGLFTIRPVTDVFAASSIYGDAPGIISVIAVCFFGSKQYGDFGHRRRRFYRQPSHQRLIDEREDDVVCIDNFNDFYSPASKRANVELFAAEPRVTLVEASICDAAKVEQLFSTHDIQQVVNLAAYAGVRYSIENPRLYVESNVAGALTLLEAATRHPVKRFLQISSCTVYGRGATVPFVEDGPLGIPMSPYSATKRSAELLGLTYHDLHRVPVVVIRPFSVYGSRLRPDLALMIFTAAILEGKPLPLFGDGSIRRDFTHVSDLCTGLIRALDAEGVVGEAINLGHRDPVAILEVIATLEKALDREAVIDRQPEKPGDMPITFADLSKAQKLLDYHPRVEFADGVREFVAWYQNQRTIGSSTS